MENRFKVICKTCKEPRLPSEFKGSPTNVVTCIYCKKENQRKANEKRKKERDYLLKLMGY